MRIGLYGYGNLSKGIEYGIRQNPDMELAAVFTRRSPETVSPLTEGVPVYRSEEAPAHREDIDVMIVCGGSRTDLPVQTPMLAQYFHVVDSFDTHARIREHYENVDRAARESGHVGIISVGWDPGLFSLYHLYGNAVIPEGRDYAFWGRGVSQGHGDAIRRIEGVADARQYTIPVPEALDAVRGGGTPELTVRQKHTRDCYVVAKPGADRERIAREIRTMPNYFSDYDTTVTFITEEEMKRDHSGLPHQGYVFRNGSMGPGGSEKATMEFRVAMDSNPSFTGSALLAYARAAFRLAGEGQTGCRTVLDVAPAYLVREQGADLVKYLQ